MKDIKNTTDSTIKNLTESKFKPITETHPSLKGKGSRLDSWDLAEVYYEKDDNGDYSAEDIQKHTRDVAKIREAIELTTRPDKSNLNVCIVEELLKELNIE